MVMQPFEAAKMFPTAADRIEKMPKVTPEIMVIIYLDEIAGRLAELQERLTEITGEGHLYSKTFTVSTEPLQITVNARHVSFANDGTADVYIMQVAGTPSGQSPAPLRNGESLPLDMGSKGVRRFYASTSTGTASLRVFAW